MGGDLVQFFGFRFQEERSIPVRLDLLRGPPPPLLFPSIQFNGSIVACWGFQGQGGRGNPGQGGGAPDSITFRVVHRVEVSGRRFFGPSRLWMYSINSVYRFASGRPAFVVIAAGVVVFVRSIA